MYRELQSLPGKWDAVKKAFKQIPKEWIRTYQADKQENDGAERTEELGTGKRVQCCWSIKLSWGGLWEQGRSVGRYIYPIQRS